MKPAYEIPGFGPYPDAAAVAELAVTAQRAARFILSRAGNHERRCRAR
jgi:hypothetical protein